MARFHPFLWLSDTALCVRVCVCLCVCVCVCLCVCLCVCCSYTVYVDNFFFYSVTVVVVDSFFIHFSINGHLVCLNVVFLFSR